MNVFDSKKILYYMHTTIDMPMIIEAGGMDVMQIRVDASYTIHVDMEGHTRGLMTLGRGMI